MITVDKKLSTSLPKGVIAWFNQYFYYLDATTGAAKPYILPQNMHEGAIVNVPPAQYPALSVYITKDAVNSDYQHEIGTLHIDVMFNTAKEYAAASQQYNDMLSAIRSQLLSNPRYLNNNRQYIVTFLFDNYVPGLVQLVTKSETDMSRWKDQLNNAANSSFIFGFELTYKINIYLNQKGMWKTDGTDYISPVYQVYPQNTAVDAVITNIPTEA